MTNVNKLLEKINTVADNKEQVENLKKQQEQDLADQYKEQIKELASRVDNMLLIVNTLIKRKLYDTGKIGIGNAFEGIHFFGGDTYEMRYKSPYKIVAYTYGNDSNEKAVYVYADGTIKHMNLNYQSDYENQYRIPSQYLFKFIVAFEQVEQKLQTYIENL